jgi:hypothetical protein
MITFLFWNLNKKSITDSVTNTATHYGVDVLILAENTIPKSSMLLALNKVERARYHFNSSLCEKIQIYSRFPQRFIRPVSESGRFSIRLISLPGLTEILLAAVHLPSKVNWSDDDLSTECQVLSNKIGLAEQQANCHNTVLVGDFNMNPFEAGVVNANGLHAVMARDIALKGMRTVQGQEYPFFYNPMWGRFGDETEGPCGTHYFPHSGHKSFFWNIYDQVLLRPSLLSHFHNEELKILTSDGKQSLLSESGLPKVSDHLPILFKLDL